MYILLAFVGCLSVASAADLNVGVGGGRVIFDQNVTASPAIWQQAKNLTVNATENDVISRVIIIDNRPGKDGEAKIVEGGEGHNNVTIELKSPAVFRGFDFTIQVFGQNGDAQVPQTPQIVVNDGQSQVPHKDLDVNDGTQKHQDADVIIEQKPTNDDQQEVQNPAVIANEQTRQNRETTEQKEQSQVPLNVATQDERTENTDSIADKHYNEFKGVVSSIFPEDSKKNEDSKDAGRVGPAVFDKDLSQQTQKSDISTTPRTLQDAQVLTNEDLQQVKGLDKDLSQQTQKSDISTTPKQDTQVLTNEDLQQVKGQQTQHQVPLPYVRH